MKKNKKINTILLLSLVLFLIGILIWQLQTKNGNVVENNNVVIEENAESKEVDLKKQILNKEEFSLFLEENGYSTVEFDNAFNDKYFNATENIGFEDVVVKQNENSKYYYFTYFSVGYAKEVFEEFLIKEDSRIEDLKGDYYNYWNVEKQLEDKNVKVSLLDNVILFYIGDSNELLGDFLIFNEK